MPDKVTFTFTDGLDRSAERQVNLTLNALDFKGRPGFALLILAANPHLSVRVLQMVLEHWGCERGRAWISKRRWLFQDADSVRSPGVKADADGKDAQALMIMRKHSTLSLSRVVRLLRESGIRRSREWVRRHRCD